MVGQDNNSFAGPELDPETEPTTRNSGNSAWPKAVR